MTILFPQSSCDRCQYAKWTAATVTAAVTLDDATEKWLDLCIYLRFLTTFLIIDLVKDFRRLNSIVHTFSFSVFLCCVYCMHTLFFLLHFFFAIRCCVSFLLDFLFIPCIRIVQNKKKNSVHIPYLKWCNHLRFAVSLSLSLTLLFYIFGFICVNKGKLSPVCKLFRNDILYSYKLYICMYTYIHNVIVFIDKMNRKTWWEMWMKSSIPTMMMNWVYREVRYSFLLHANNSNNTNHV